MSGQRKRVVPEWTHMSRPPLATSTMLSAAEPILLKEWHIFPPTSVWAVSFSNAANLRGRAGGERDIPYSTPILGKKFRQPMSLAS